MMKLRFSPASPYVRKVRIAADLLGLTDRLELVQTDTADPATGLREENPLGKIPALITETGEAFYDSRVIVEYLDHIGGGGLIPKGHARFPALRHQALADGILDAALLQVYEGRYRPEEHRVQAWLDMQAGKVSRGLAYLEGELSRPEASLHIGHVAQACALGYLDLRFAGAWRDGQPRLVAWLDDFAARVPAFETTRA